MHDKDEKTVFCMVATSNRSEDIDIGFRRGGRLEHEIVVVNSLSDRATLIRKYLELLVESSRHSEEEMHQSIAQLTDNEKQRVVEEIANATGGYVAADIVALMREVQSALSESKPEIPNFMVDDREKTVLKLFEDKMKVVTPSCLRGVSIQTPKLTFNDVIGYDEVKLQLQKVLSFSSVIMKEKLQKFGLLNSLGGVLLYGPPGNCKTRLVSATASSFKLPLISLSSADVYSAYVGDAEAEIRKAFSLARQAAPCILFFDEMDSLVTNRATDKSFKSSSASVEARVLSTFLNEMDGISTHASSSGVIVIGATNRIDCIDAALLRKVRLSLK